MAKHGSCIAMHGMFVTCGICKYIQGNVVYEVYNCVYVGDQNTFADIVKRVGHLYNLVA